MPEKKTLFDFMPTCVGSIPFLDIKATCKEIVTRLPDIPFWPQFVRKSPLEDMIIQYTEGLPLLEVDSEKRETRITKAETEAGLVEFYEHFLSDDLDYFAISKDYACGLYELIDLLSAETEPSGQFIKGQTVGPVTFTSAINDHNNIPVINNPDIAEAFTKGLSIKALWQIKKMEETNRHPILFLDEPSLSGVGSAFSSIQKEGAVSMLKEVIGYLKEKSNALIGIHCCSNTDWSLITEANPDIINFDAFDYMEHFLLYRDEISAFLENGNILAWGIVPTSSLSGNESVEELFTKLAKGIEQITDWGIDANTIVHQSILTPACGMGSMSPKLAGLCMDLLCNLSKKCRSDGGLF